MDLRTDSVNDVLKHYGIPPGTGKTYTETLYTSQAVEALQNALNTLVYDRDLLEGTKLYKITM